MSPEFHNFAHSPGAMAKSRRATIAALAALNRKSGNLRPQQSHQRNGETIVMYISAGGLLDF
jgi:hypothetical protein